MTINNNNYDRTIVTAGHCLCNIYDEEPDAAALCKMNKASGPTDQHTAYDNKNDKTNYIYVKVGKKLLNKKDTEIEVRHAYVMITNPAAADQSVVGPVGDSYDIGLIVTKHSMENYGVTTMILPKK